MSRRRYISTDISTDIKTAELAEHGTLPLLLYTWAIPHMDDWGRMTGDARQFKLLVCPALDVSSREVDEALNQIAGVGLWKRYEVDGKQVISIDEDSWFKHQSYINKAKRGDDSGSNYPKTPSNTEEHRKSPQNAVSFSPSPSPSPSHSKDDTYSGMIEILNLYCKLHNKIDPHIKDAERTAMKELAESGVPIEFTLEIMQQLYDYKTKKKEKISSFTYYPDIIKDAYKRQTLPQAAGGEVFAQYRRSNPSSDDYYEQLRGLSTS